MTQFENIKNDGLHVRNLARTERTTFLINVGRVSARLPDLFFTGARDASVAHTRESEWLQ